MEVWAGYCENFVLEAENSSVHHTLGIKTGRELQEHMCTERDWDRPRKCSRVLTLRTFGGLEEPLEEKGTHYSLFMGCLPNLKWTFRIVRRGLVAFLFL